MATIIQNAAGGQRKAMEYLYNSNKQKVFFVAKSLVKDEDKAAEITAQAFKTVFGNLKNEKVADEKAFTLLVIRRAAEQCKKIILKQNPRAYQVSFTVSNPKDASGVTENYAEFVFEQFNDLQKLIFVLHTAGGFDNNMLTVVTKLDKKNVEAALAAEKENVERICGGALTYEAICESFIRNEKQAKVPLKCDDAVKVAIQNISAPIAKAKQKKIISVVAIVLAACLIIGGGIWLFSGSNDDVSNASGDVSDLNLSIDMDKTYYADIDIKDYGKITVKLDQSQAPITVDNFVSLAKSGFYDGLTFHRIIEGFMMQGGDPDGNGTGGSSKKIFGEFSMNGHNNTISHTRGVISMARSNDMNSASSQFFIVHEDASASLDGRYAAFGYVTKGMDVVDAVCESAKPTDNNGTIPSADQPIINKITIREE